MNVPVHQHGPLVVVGSYAPCRAGQGVLDGRLGARMAQLLPLSGDEIDELARFVGSSRQAGTRRRPPHRGRRRHQYLQPFGEWAAQLVEGGPEALQQQRTPGGVVAQQAGAAPAPGQPQHCDLVTSSRAVARNQQFQHCRRAVAETGLGHEGLAGVRVGPLHRDRPLGLELGDQAREVPQPPVGSAGRRSVGHHIGDAQRHFPRFAQAPPGSSCVATATHRGGTTGTISLPRSDRSWVSICRSG